MTQGPVGYMTRRAKGLTGSQGSHWDYVLGHNGLFVQSRSDALVARFQVAPALVKGLADVDEKMELLHGRIPATLFQRGLEWFRTVPDRERFFAVRWAGGRYRLAIPEQLGTGGRVSYSPPEDAVLEFHSHARFAAFFSSTDDRDEQLFRIYGVVGRLDAPEPEVCLRLGVYGHFRRLGWGQVFDGPIPGVRMAVAAKRPAAAVMEDLLVKER